jgi:hypothetical protein
LNNQDIRKSSKTGGLPYLRINPLKLLVFTLILLSSLIISNPSGEAINKTTLPSLEGWKMDSLFSVPLKSAKGMEGWWSEATYSNPPNPIIKVVIIEGPNVPWSNLKYIEASPDNEGLFDSEATYELIQINGKKGVLESHPLLGNTLALSLTPQTTITMETKGPKSYLLQFSQLLLQTIPEETD